MNHIDILKQCLVQGKVVKLPDIQLERKLYLDVKKSLELIGGQWKGGKTKGFVFDNDPSDLLESVISGDKRNLKQEFQFFPTPVNLATFLVSLSNLRSDHSALEPSAGRGAIIKAINEIFPDMQVDCYELMDINRTFLSGIPTANLLGDDFLLAQESEIYDRIIANPPFKNNQDIDHVQKMYRLLKPGGKIVSVVSRHWQVTTNKKICEFKDWLNTLDHQLIELEAGQFKESGTNVAASILVINKPDETKSAADYLVEIREHLQQEVDIVDNKELLSTVQGMKQQFPENESLITRLESMILGNNVLGFANTMGLLHQEFNKDNSSAKTSFSLETILPDKTLNIYNQAVKSKDVGTLAELLHPVNKNLRKHFSKTYGTKLPRSAKGIKQSLEFWVKG